MQFILHEHTFIHNKCKKKIQRSVFLSIFLIFLMSGPSAIAADLREDQKATFLAFPWTTGGVTKYGLANGDGRVISDPQWDSVGDFMYVIERYFEEPERTLTVRTNNRYGLIDDSGKIIIQPIWDDLKPITEGLIAAQKNGKWGFIDKKGRAVIPFLYEHVQSFSEGLASIQINGRTGYIDKAGKTIIPPTFSYGGRFYGGAAHIVGDDGKKGAIDKTGSIVAPPIHTNVLNEDSSLFLDVRDGVEIYVDRSGRAAFPSVTWSDMGFSIEDTLIF
jgi:hypothetical protein